MFFRKKKIDKGSDNMKLFKSRMKIIKQIADRNMQKAQCGGHFLSVIMLWFLGKTC